MNKNYWMKFSTLPVSLYPELGVSTFDTSSWGWTLRYQDVVSRGQTLFSVRNRVWPRETNQDDGPDVHGGKHLIITFYLPYWLHGWYL